MAKPKDITQTGSDATKDVSHKAKDLAQTTYEGAKNVAQATYANVKDKTQQTLDDVQGRPQGAPKMSQVALEVIAGLAQGLASFNQKRARKQLNSWQSSVQDTVGPRASSAQDALQSGIESTQAAFTKTSKQAQQNLKKAQENFKNLQATVQQNVGAGLAATQDTWARGTQQARQAARNVRKVSDDLQHSYERAARRRARNRRLFRWGLIVGIVLALLYTPVAGPEIRRGLAEQFNQLRTVVGF